MTQISGICDFLDQAGTQFRVFDMGRRIQPLSRDQFLAFEQGELAYPFPLQQQAWLGMMIWDEKKPGELVIWFLRFPLDARGCLTPGIRDDFVYRLINRDKQGEDESSPYGFKPKQEHMATFHAKAAKILGQSGSRFYEHAQDYFSGKPGFDQWAFVGFQGIADVAARLDEATNQQDLVAALPQLPAQPLDALCQCLEHETIDDQLAATLGVCLDEELAKESVDANRISLLLRAVSGAHNSELCAQQVEKVLNSPVADNPEVLASISGRCWETLKQPGLIRLFLENLARCPEGQEFFNLVIVDLINIPGMQDAMHTAIRQTERSDILSRAIGELFQHFTQET
jgi:hypothetical protein